MDNDAPTMPILYRKYFPAVFRPMLAVPYTKQRVPDVRGYWMSEKLDGVRALLHDGQLHTRENKRVIPPAEWMEQLVVRHPEHQKCVLDGELFIERGAFHDVSSLVTAAIKAANRGGGHSKAADWSRVTFVAFDVANVFAPFERRAQMLRDVVDACKSPVMKAAEHVLVSSETHLNGFLNDVVEGGGEGVMLRRPQSKYVNGVSDCLFKVKIWHDHEAVVLDAELRGAGDETEMKTLLVKWCRDRDEDKARYKDVAFPIGSGFRDAERRAHADLFPAGTVIKVKYFELETSGVPRFGTYVCTVTCDATGEPDAKRTRVS